MKAAQRRFSERLEEVRLNGGMRPAPAYRVCVICSGNICRSPMGEVILRSMLGSAGLGDHVVVDSVGTGGWHEGESMDRRAAAVLRDAGYDPSRHRGEQRLAQAT